MTQKEWLTKLEKITGYNIQEMFDKLSSDQLIGKVRVAEDGKDPFENDRMEIFEQFLDTHADSRVDSVNPFRDERDEEIWNTINFRTVLLPPQSRKMKTQTVFGRVKTN